mgnify:CR=1 FL=1
MSVTIGRVALTRWMLVLAVALAGCDDGDAALDLDAADDGTPRDARDDNDVAKDDSDARTADDTPAADDGPAPYDAAVRDVALADAALEDIPARDVALDIALPSDGSTAFQCPPPPDGMMRDGRCLLSCGGAGGNTCTSSAALCAGEQGFDAYDCARCCLRCDRRTAAPGRLPLIHYYGFVPAEAPATGPDDALNQRLLVPGLEVVFGVSSPTLFDAPGFTVPTGTDLNTGTLAAYPTCAPQPEAFLRWHARGARLARIVSNEALQAWLGNGTAADRVERILRFGWDYITVDEVGGVAWRDSGAFAPAAVAMLNELARRGLDRRVIFWLNPSTTEVWRNPADAPTGALGEYRALLAACRDRCRAFVFETYPQNTDVVCAATRSHCVTTSTVVGPEDTSRYFEWLATRASNAAPGLNNTALSGLGLANLDRLRYLDLPRCDLAPLRGTCTESPGRGGLFRQFAALHAGAHSNNQRGVAFYGHNHMAATATWSRADLVEHLRGLTSWWVGR